MPDLAVLVVVALAAFRLTRLVTTDSLTQPFRTRLFHFAWDEEHSTEDDEGYLIPAVRAVWRTYVHELFTCSWCLGVWVSVGTYALWDHGSDVGHTIVAVAAVAGVQGALAQFVQAATPDNGRGEQ